MRICGIRSSFLLLLLLCIPVVVPAAQVVLVLRLADGSWQIQEGEKLTFNQKDKLRVGPRDKAELRPDEYKALRPAPAAQVGMIRRHAGGFLARKSGDGWDPVVPDGLNLKTSSSLAAIWSSTAIALQRDKNAKSAGQVQSADLFAILPGPDASEAVVNFILEPGNFTGTGQKDDAASFEERMSLLVGTVPFVQGPAAGRLKQFLLAEMVSAERKLSAGSAQWSVLQEGLRYAVESEKAYPGDEQQRKVRDSLRQQEDWVIQQAAILKTLAAGGLWDPLIEKYSKFERWGSSFEDIRKLWEGAFARSAEDHIAGAKRRTTAKLPCAAKEELTLALKLAPGNREARVLLDDAISECENLQGSTCGKAEDPKTSDYRTVTQYLADTDSYASTGRFEDAEASLASADARAKGSPRVLFTRANLFMARKKPLLALAELDKFTGCVSGPDAEKGAALKSKIRITLENDKKQLNKAISDAEAAGDYTSAMKKLDEALALDDSDAQFLLRGGIEASINRRYDDAEKFLQSYLSLPASVTGSKRAEVINLAPLVKPRPAVGEGAANWFSGYKSPAGVFYCPISLAPSVHIAEVHASRKQNAVWQWANNRLISVQTTTQQAAGFNAYFDYFKDGRGVRRISEKPFDPKEDPPVPAFTPNGVVSKASGTFLALANHPAIDPLMVSRLMGKNVAVVVTGNPYFQPFVWNGIYAFVVQYDDQNRVASAHLIVDEGQPSFDLDFKWDGPRLTEIAERGGAGYRRTMNYRDGRLLGEIVSFHGKNSKIEYKYIGDRLASAHCDDDQSLEGRSRDVVFR